MLHIKYNMILKTGNTILYSFFYTNNISIFRNKLFYVKKGTFRGSLNVYKI